MNYIFFLRKKNIHINIQRFESIIYFSYLGYHGLYCVYGVYDFRVSLKKGKKKEVVLGLGVDFVSSCGSVVYNYIINGICIFVNGKRLKWIHCI